MTTETPSYQRLAERLESLVSDSAPGDRLPSENELVASHDVSRLTARAAIQELERRHLVRRIRGLGTFVARRIDYRISADMAPSWSETVRAAGGDPRRKVLGLGVVSAPQHVSQVLGLPARAEVVALTRLGYIDNQVADLSTSWIPAHLITVEELTMGGESLYSSLSATGLLPVRRWTGVELEPVPVEVAATLEVEGRPMVWRVASCNQDATTLRPVELSESWMRPDVYRVSLHLGDATSEVAR